MLLTPAQKQIAEDTHRFRVVVCGRKFGKTTLEAEELIGKALYINDAKVMYVAPTLGDARGLLWDRLNRKLKGVTVYSNDQRLELKIRNVHGGISTIELGSWEKYDNYRGFEYDFLVFDEVQDYKKFWVGWNEAMFPTLMPRKGEALFCGTAKGFNHFYDLFNQGFKDPLWANFRFTSFDNPHLSVDEIETEKRQLPEDTFAQEYLAEFRKSSGLVFKDFDRETHTFSDKLYGFTESLAGIDFGFTNPTAILYVKVKDGSYYVTDELYRTGMTGDEIADYVAAQRFNKVYPDPAQAAEVEQLRRAGINVRDVSKGPDSITHGINKVRELFKQNRLFIHTSCVNLIGELETYSYADSKEERNPTEKPLDKANHAIDALRYVVSTHSIQKPFVKPLIFKDKTIDIWRGR